MKTKICPRCKIEKDIVQFNKRLKKDKINWTISSYCKLCQKEYDKKMFQNKFETITAQHKKYIIDNKEKYNVTRKKHRIKYYEENKVLINQKKKDRRNKDLSYKISNNLSTLIRISIKNQSGVKACKTNEYLGCTGKEAKNYITSLFTKNMNEDNYGLLMDNWQIDHIIPRSYFDLTNINEAKKCFHYTNLMPLWCKDNLEKSDKIFKTKIELQYWLEKRGYEIPDEFTYL